MATDHMHCMDAKQLLTWLLCDIKKGHALGIPKKLFFSPKSTDPFRLERYGKMLETPVGVAAGPHTQMAHNLIASWLCGARYLELKTVQVLDSITVTKPCINMADEGYNCEWSQELNLEASFNEYLKALVIVYILHDYLGFEGDPGVLFNMSAGYSMEGILSPTMQRFLDKMQSCPEEILQLKKELAPLYPRVMDLPIPDYVSRDLTISCMHGCPPEEVEKIALYFIGRNLNTTLKLNATLLGAEHVRNLVNNVMGYDAIIPDIAFEHDLSYDTTLEILKKCVVAAEKQGVCFGVKLTNTLETQNTTSGLPENEKMVYMSGKPLHPIAIALAAKLHKDFGKSLDISFCAGADALNVADTLSCNLAPITVCSDLLKPGGYTRLAQYMINLREAMKDVNAGDIPSFIKKKANKDCVTEATQVNLDTYTEQVASPRSRYARATLSPEGTKTKRALPLLDCASAPCKSACPAGQDIPAYIEHAARGNVNDSLAVIMTTNPFPTVLGKVCNQKCKNACMRIHYDDPVQIRSIKGCVALQTQSSLTPLSYNGFSVAIVGADVEALSCAYFLALNGCRVALHTSENTIGGMLTKLAKEKDAVTKDLDAILALGVTVTTGAEITGTSIATLFDEYDALYIAEGEASFVENISEKSIVMSPRIKENRKLSLVELVGEGRCAAQKICAKLAIIPSQTSKPASTATVIEDICEKQAFKIPTLAGKDVTKEFLAQESERCLQCDKYCGICVSVCPNRANMAVLSPERTWVVQEAVKNGDSVDIHTLSTQRLHQTWQIINIGDFCNECGNCEAFCPSSGAPYQAKQRVHVSENSFAADKNGILSSGNGRFTGKHNGMPWQMYLEENTWVYEDTNLNVTLDKHTLTAEHLVFKTKETSAGLGRIAQLAILCEALCDASLINIRPQ